MRNRQLYLVYCYQKGPSFLSFTCVVFTYSPSRVPTADCGLYRRWVVTRSPSASLVSSKGSVFSISISAAAAGWSLVRWGLPPRAGTCEDQGSCFNVDALLGHYVSTPLSGAVDARQHLNVDAAASTPVSQEVLTHCGSTPFSGAVGTHIHRFNAYVLCPFPAPSLSLSSSPLLSLSALSLSSLSVSVSRALSQQRMHLSAEDAASGVSQVKSSQVSQVVAQRGTCDAHKYPLCTLDKSKSSQCAHRMLWPRPWPR